MSCTEWDVYHYALLFCLQLIVLSNQCWTEYLKDIFVISVQGQIQENRTASENITFATFFTVETLRQIKIILIKLCFDDRHKIHCIQLEYTVLVVLKTLEVHTVHAKHWKLAGLNHFLMVWLHWEVTGLCSASFTYSDVRNWAAFNPVQKWTDENQDLNLIDWAD